MTVRGAAGGTVPDMSATSSTTPPADFAELATGPALVAARAGWAAARAALHEALVAAIGAVVHAEYPSAAQVGFVTDTASPPQLERVDVADDTELFLGAVRTGDPGFAELAELHAELVEATGDVEAELDLVVAG